MGIDHDDLWKEEERMVQAFVTEGCQCHLDHNEPCNQQFGPDVYIRTWEACRKLSHEQLDMHILGQLSACVDMSSETAHSASHHHTRQDQTDSHTEFRHAGKRVCHTIFQFFHGVGKWRVKALKVNLMEYGLTPCVHGNVK